MGRAIDALIAFRLIKLLVTRFDKTEAYKLGIIDEKGKVLIKARDFNKAFPDTVKRAKAKKSYTMLTRFVFNLKRLFRKYDTSKDLKMRLIINHIIVLANVFGVDAATTLLFFKIEKSHWPILKAFLIFLRYMPENDLMDVQINHEVMGKLGQI